MTLSGGHQGSISKILSDARNNLALACGYDGNITAWSISHEATNSSSSSSSNSSQRTTSGSTNSRAVVAGIRAAQAALSPIQIYSASDIPITEADYLDGQLFAGTKDGSVQMWDLESSVLKQKMKAHPGPVTSILLPIQDNNDVFMTGVTAIHFVL